MSREFKLSQYEETIRLILDQDGEFRMYPKGTSMLPLIRQKKDSIVLLKPLRPLRKRDIIFYKRDSGQYVLHRILQFRKDGYVLCGDNQVVKEYGITDSHVIGVVKAVWREERCISVEDRDYRLYAWLYCGMFPLRAELMRMKTLLGRFKSRAKIRLKNIRRLIN